MSGKSSFDKEPGSDLPTRIENIGRSSLDVVRPQLWLIREDFFTDAAGGWPKSAFSAFVQLPIVAGYILGLVGAYLARQNITLTEVEALRCVLDTNNHYLANQLDAEITLHYATQQSMFKLGLDIGMADVTKYLNERSQNGRGNYVLLAAACLMLLKYDDARTLKLNLALFCKSNGILARSDDVLKQVVDRWESQKQYSMRLRPS